ncbi:MAG: PAS domain S-box protein [Clostridia bacterium]|nr:PAS domain S-box protein [Clostridia bacterium]
MEEKKTDQKKDADLRRRAEKRVSGNPVAGPKNLASLSLEDTQRLLQELQVHQVELKMQNEELRQTQLELKASHARYFELYNLAPFGYLTLDEHGRIQEANHTGARLLAMERNNLLKRPLTDFIASEDQDIFYLYRRQLDAKQTQQACEIRMDKKDDSQFWAQVEIAVVPDCDSGINVYRAVIMDITERKQAEELLKSTHLELEQRVKERTLELEKANKKLFMEITEREKIEHSLQKSEEHFRQMVEMLPVAIFCHNQKEIVFANKEAADLVHLDNTQDFAGKSLLEFLHLEDQEIFTSKFKLVMAKKVPKESLAAKIVSFIEAIIDVELFLTSFPYQGDPVVQITAYNITRRKKIEEEIFKAEKLKSISILAGGIAHDFNNYLTVLLGNISMAMRHKDIPDKVYKFLENMKQATLQTKDLTSQFFVFAKGGEPVKEVSYIDHLIIESTDFALSGSNVRCRFSFPEELQLVEIDRGQITQVLYNIIINAVQAMPDGGTIWVKAENITLEPEGSDIPESLPAGDYVKVAIKDEGHGIPAESLQKIFDPFFTTKEQGNGLGLAGSYAIIKNHNGSIQAESQVGKGTTLSFLIPASTQTVAKSSEEDQIIYGTGKILIMDDEEAIREVIGQMLTSLGYEAQFARDGAEAIKVYLEAKKTDRPFDLIIMDMTIKGGMGGKETIKELLKKDSEARVIVASGYFEDPVMANFREYGFNGVVKKPFSIEELGKVINEVLRRI